MVLFAIDKEHKVKVHAERIIFEVITYMNNIGEGYLAVYSDNNTLLGEVCVADLVAFLEHEPEKKLYYHKLNYTMETFLRLKVCR